MLLLSVANYAEMLDLRSSYRRLWIAWTAGTYTFHLQGGRITQVIIQHVFNLEDGGDTETSVDFYQMKYTSLYLRRPLYSLRSNYSKFLTRSEICMTLKGIPMHCTPMEELNNNGINTQSTSRKIRDTNDWNRAELNQTDIFWCWALNIKFN